MNANANLYGPAMEPDLHQAPEPKWPSAATSVFVWARQQLPPATEANPAEPPAQPEFPVRASAAAPIETPAPAKADAATSWELQALTKELETARAELDSLHALLEDIPGIFERKFEQRLQPLLAENLALRQQVLQLKQAESASSQQALLSPRLLRQAFGRDKAA